MSDHQSDAIIQRDFLAQHGFKLIEQGYTVIPIQPGTKKPGFDGWQKTEPSKNSLREWLGNGFKNAGVGILTKFTCAIDIDCLNPEAAEHFERRCLELLGPAPIRIGKAPKRLLVYRTLSPFRKKNSSMFKDEWGDDQKIEILGDGQQFVAFHIHKDTGKPYTWVNGQSPLTIKATDLTEVTDEQLDKLIDEFDAYGKDQEWKVTKERRRTEFSVVDSENPWVEDSQPIEISTDELRNKLMLIPVDGVSGDGDYETWYSVGMALYHQFNGDEEGKELWSEWSETSHDFDQHEIDDKWDSGTFDVHGKGRAPLTARYIMRLAKESVEKTALELGNHLKDLFIGAKDLVEWEKARQEAKHAEIDSLARSSLAVIAKERRDAITGTRTPLIEIKRAISYIPKKSEKAPKWCEDWVYDVSKDKFFHLDRKIAVTSKSFDAMYDRQALTKADILAGKASASLSASDQALNKYQIPIVEGTRFYPGQDRLFSEYGGRFANSYSEHEMPAKPDKVLPVDVSNVERVKRHIAHLLEREDEQAMLLDWLSWVVQNPGKHVNYAIILQGTQGDGKTFLAEMMRAVMGVSNVSVLNGDVIISSQFTDWAMNSCLCCVEEIRIKNSNSVDKWEVTNKIKQFLSNNTISVHPKGEKPITIKNVTSYLMLTNYKDAVPLDDNDRKYNVLFSRWQQREDLLAFIEEHPSYYDRLYRALVESPGAIREWLLNHKQSGSFNPFGMAPDTHGRQVMIRKSKSEFIQVLSDIIADDKTLGASRMLLDVSDGDVHDAIRGLGCEWPGPKAIAGMLERDGYEQIGKVRLDKETVHTFYSKCSDNFYSRTPDGMNLDATKVRAYLSTRKHILEAQKMIADDL